ncbi:putative glycosyltransferase [Halobacteroides halobius DSM 5150]|uniref:Putative glycosyltransferase n=1 Tax=Halobacteroides halobius (strain ATCC 35273 / DSM 5150 / MD-1) TaxID=748449 RepID=L0KAK1_HALHC|nr:PilZ domain-containing protein [Halobacteroides halobius]AGB41575.1 putative glycosyltransferase [Halobacteroides halobius DSM 5150]
MLNKVFIGQSVKISKQETEEYRAKIINLKRDTIRLRFFGAVEKVGFIQQGQILKLSLIKNGALYKLNVKVKNIDGLNNSCWVVKQGGFTRIQRRKHVRVPIQQEIEYKESKKSRYKKGIVLDISGGGMRIRIKELAGLELGSKIEVRSDFLPLAVNIIDVEIVRITANQDPEAEKRVYDVGVEFVDLPEVWKEEIIEWVFKEQRKLRKRGKI